MGNRLGRAAWLWWLVGAALHAQGSQPTTDGRLVGPTVNQGAADTSVFAPLALLPSPNGYRSASGAPGPRYWQNRADYEIRATLDTGTKVLTGWLRLRYTNASPDTLRFLWFQVEQNAFGPRSLMADVQSDAMVDKTPVTAMDSSMGGSMAGMMMADMGPEGGKGGDMIDRVDLVRSGRSSEAPSTHTPLHTRVEGTELKADLPEPLAPGTVATLEIAWHFAVPLQGGPRMGRDGSLYELAQWYPRVAVYDDLHGWNTDPYLLNGEFYLEYGDFTYALTVPAGYIVAATGTLQNPTEVLTPAQRIRLARAVSSTTPVAIVTAAELANGTARPRSTGTLTWRFQAHHVRDVAWAAAPDYQWDASGWHGVIAQAYYRPATATTWKEAADMARTSIEEYSTRWYPYPYPQITAVEGPVMGMEYPMLAMEASHSDRYALYNVITHEIGHNWFPMVVGSNERLHAWQDEGLNSFMNTFAEARRYPDKGDQRTRATLQLAGVEAAQSRGTDLPIEVPPDRQDMQGIGYTAYGKPTAGLQLLRQEILGPEAFDDAFHSYIQRWAYKHPSPLDFFRTMEDVSGHRLDWFWREFWLGTYSFDQAIDSVHVEHHGDTDQVAVTYGNRARGVLPILVRFTFSDGSVEGRRYPADVWSKNASQYVRHYEFTGKHLARIELDPDHHLIDVDRSNNVWLAPPAS
jgi:hypothetical protein